MLKKAIQLYNKGKLEIIEKLADSSNSIYDEVCFVDDGQIAAQIERDKKVYLDLSKEIEFLASYDKADQERNNKLAYLIKKRQDILMHMAFLASNKFENLDKCLNLIEESPSDFKQCLRALKLFSLREEQEAYAILSAYIQKYDGFLNHYLLNKIYGQLLLQKRRFDEAIAYLTAAAQLRPEDVELHMWLQQLYERVDNKNGVQIETGIIALLKGAR